MSDPLINGLTFNQWLERASVPHNIHLSDRERYWCYWLAGHKPEDHTPRHVKIERAAKALLPYIDSDTILWSDMYDYERDAVEALRKALAE